VQAYQRQRRPTSGERQKLAGRCEESTSSGTVGGTSCSPDEPDRADDVNDAGELISETRGEEGFYEKTYLNPQQR